MPNSNDELRKRVERINDTIKALRELFTERNVSHSEALMALEFVKFEILRHHVCGTTTLDLKEIEEKIGRGYV